MSAVRYGLFDTVLGQCVILWGDRGITGVQLPEDDDAKARARVLRRFPDATEAPLSAELTHLVDAIRTLLRGEPVDLSGAALDMSTVRPFEGQVYEVVRSIAPGNTLTYGEVAARIGHPGAAREVGRALGANPFPIVIPCHRVIAAGGKLGGFSAPGGAATKRRLLAIESANLRDGSTLFG